MKTLKLHFAKAAIASIDGSEGNTITLMDALNGQIGQVMDIEVILNVEGLQRPAIPFIDANKINGSTPAPTQPKLSTVDPNQKVIKIRKNTKVATLFEMLTKRNNAGIPVGVSRGDLARAMDQTENGPTAYLYNYPKKWECDLKSEERKGVRFYWMEIPNTIRFDVA